MRDEVASIVNTIVGRQLTSSVVGDHPRRQSLTDFFERGAAQAALLVPFLEPHEKVMEYGGGIGRLGRNLTPHVSRLISVDVNPLMQIYGPRASPTVQFVHRDELSDTPQFDGAYSVAVFFHLSLEQQRGALEYVCRRLKPGGWFLVDLKLGPHTEVPHGEGPDSTYGPVRATSLEDFKALFEPLFTARRVPLFNSAFLLQKKDRTVAPPPATTLAGQYAVNDGSIVFDVLEGQVVVVNLDSGAYYILESTAATLWQLLAAGQRVPDIVQTLSHHHGAAAAVVDQAVDEFVAQLTAEAMLVPATGAEPPAPAFDARQLGEAGGPFTAPVMFRYTDMQALIQMDPIREYDETGWPKRHTPPPPPRPE